MSEQPQQEPQQNLNISGDTSLENVQIGGIAGHDFYLAQIQLKVVYVTVYDRFHAPDGLSGQPVSIKPLTQNESRQRKVLLNRVKKFWIEGVLEKSLHNQVFIELGLEEKPDAIQTPFLGVEEFPEQPGQNNSEGTNVTNIFEQMGPGRTLLILGEPGSGKTTTLLKLAQSLIARTEANLSQPIPVVLNLSSWSQKRQAIKEWLVEELKNNYLIPKTLGKAWVKEQQLLLLLDGLDEVRAEYRNACVGALNHFYQTHGLTEIVVCCRIKNYKALSQKLNLQGAICVQPLNTKQIEQYLAQAGNQIIALKMLLQQDAELRKFASSPLVLSVMSLAYAGCSPQALSHLLNSPEEFHKQLFDAYIERMLNRRGTAQQYSQEQTKRWLIWMAQRMAQTSQTIFWIEQLYPSVLIEQSDQSWVIYWKQRIPYWTESFLITGLLVGLIAGLFFELIFGLRVGLIAGLIAGLIVTLSDLLYLVGRIFRLFRAMLAKVTRHERSAIQQVIANALHLMPGWLFVALAAMVMSTLGQMQLAIKTGAHPNQGIWESLRNSLVSALISALFLGSIAGVFFELRVGIFAGLGAGLFSGLSEGGLACIRHFTMRLMLYRMGYLPWNYAHFLDYATERLFLQKVGGGYIFVHRMLLEHFARMELEQERR